MAALNLVSDLLALFPELEPEYLEDLKLFGPEYSLQFHSVFGQLLNPYLFSLLQQDDWLSEPKLPQIFDFIETLSNSGNPEAEELVVVTICERLGDNFEVLRRARHLMGPKTFEFSRNTEIGWGREDPYTCFIDDFLSENTLSANHSSGFNTRCTPRRNKRGQ